MAWRDLAEARIRAWLEAPPEERASPAPAEPIAPLEVELFETARREHEAARRAPDPDEERAARRRAGEAETRLFTLLDATGRSVLAPWFAEQLAAARRGEG